jgi:hypothetical protein
MSLCVRTDEELKKHNLREFKAMQMQYLDFRRDYDNLTGFLNREEMIHYFIINVYMPHKYFRSDNE